MYFLSKKLENSWLIGVVDDILYSIKETSNGLCIYQKHVFEIEKWEIFCQLKMHLAYICQYCKNNFPIAAGVYNSRIWIMSTGYIKDPSKIGPHIFSINLQTKKIRRFKTVEKRINNEIKRICIKCQCSKITFEENLNNKLLFVFESNRVKAYPTKVGMPDFPNFPAFGLFYFIIDEEKNICEFGKDENMPIFSIYSAGFISSENKLGLFIMGRDLGIGTIDEEKYNLTTLNEISDSDIVEFWRNENNKLYCFIERHSTKSNKLRIFKVYQIDFNHIEKSVSLNHKASFSVGINFPSVEKSLIFATSNLFIFQSGDVIVTAVSRMLTLFESAYFTIVNIPNNMGAKEKCWISMEFIYTHLKIPKQIKFPCQDDLSIKKCQF